MDGLQEPEFFKQDFSYFTASLKQEKRYHQLLQMIGYDANFNNLLALLDVYLQEGNYQKVKEKLEEANQYYQSNFNEEKQCKLEFYKAKYLKEIRKLEEVIPILENLIIQFQELSLKEWAEHSEHLLYEASEAIGMPLEHFFTEPNRTFTSQILAEINHGNTAINYGKYIEAESYFLKAKKLHNESSINAIKGTICNGLGVVYKNLGNYIAAEQYLKEAVEIHEHIGNRKNLVVNYANLSNLYQILGLINEAIVVSKRSIILYQSLIVGTDLGEKYSFIDKYGVSLITHLRLLLLDQLPAAFEFREKFVHKPLYEKVVQNLKEFYPIYDLDRLYGSVGRNEVGLVYVNIETDMPGVFAITRTQTNFYKLDRVSFEKYVEQEKNNNESVWAEMRNFDPKPKVIYDQFLKKELTKRNLKKYQPQKFKTLLQEVIVYYLDRIFEDGQTLPYYKTSDLGFKHENQQQIFYQELEKLHEIGARLYRFFVPEELEHQLADKKDLLIVPDGYMEFMPFESLLDRNSEYVIKNKNVQYAHGINIKRALKNRKYDSNIDLSSIAIMGDPKYKNYDGINHQDFGKKGKEELTFFQNELDITPLLESERFNKENFLEALNRSNSKPYNIIHVSCHGLVVSDFPDVSNLVVSDNSESDSKYIYAKEIANLKLEANCVVLSACSTTLGKVYRGVGSQGLKEAFLAAGANGVIAASWDVPISETLDFFKKFYTSLNPRLPSFTLCEVKRQFLESKNPLMHHPYYWAAFTYYGA